MKEFSILLTLAIIAVVAAVGYVSSKYLGDDNVVEELSEEVIEDMTGVDVDLTPSSPERTP